MILSMIKLPLPSKSVQRLTQSIVLGAAALLWPGGAALAAPAATFAAPATNPAPVRIARINGVPTLKIDGGPFLLVGAQCDVWRGVRQDEKTAAFFDGYQAMNATAVSVDVPWSKIELAKDRYDFQFLDWFIQQARQRGLKLVVDLFDSNVCGKIREGEPAGAGPCYTPAYLLDAPADYQRMVLPGPWKYNPGGPPMCPNDPRTLDRERRLCVQVAMHLKQTDLDHTVIMLQIDNEFYYNQWLDAPPAGTEIRCHCQFCEAKWRAGGWKDSEDFMFHSFASYVRELTDAITAVDPLPLYLNSPWWPPHVIPIFLDNCPQLALVGVDGVFAPNEPNIFSRSQVGRNLPFASENPTENPKTRINLDVLPYYSLIGQQGIGNLLWECGPPFTVVDDPPARQRYGAALYPLRWAQAPIAEARGSDHLLGWYLIRDISTNVTTDVFGNFIPAQPAAPVVAGTHLFIREGARTRQTEAAHWESTLGRLKFSVTDSAAGIIVHTAPQVWVIAVPHGRIAIEGARSFRIEEGRYEGNQWHPEGAFAFRTEGTTTVLEVKEPKVLQLTLPND
jgi:hypothetical protein